MAPLVVAMAALGGGMTEVVQGYVRDATEAKKRWDALEPPPGASRDQVLAAGDARLDLYLRLRNKLTCIADQHTIDGKRVDADCGSGDPAGTAVPRARERLDPEGRARCLGAAGAVNRRPLRGSCCSTC